MSELFDVSSFSSLRDATRTLDDATRDFQLENLSSKKKIGKRCGVPLSLGTHAATDPAWDNGSALPEVSSKKICALTDRSEVESSEEKEGFKVGDRIETDGSEETEIVSVTVSNTNKSKSSDCWYTPLEIVALIQNCLQGITLDPCADDGKHIESCYHFTIADDGLSRQWFGRVFMNPPYSCPGVWIAKLQEEFNCGRVEEAIALMPVATDTKWFHPLISSNLICFWKGRIKFLDVNYQPKMPARQSHCLIYWGKNQSRFRQVFSPFGTFNSSEEKGAMSPTTLVTNVECNLNTPASLRESPVLNSELNEPEQANSSKQNCLLKTTPTLKQSSNTDSPTLSFTATSRTITLNRENSISTQSVFPAPAPALQATEPDLTTQNQACGFKPYAASPTANPISPSSKILRGLSVEDFEQCLEDCEWSNIVGTIHKSFQQRNSERRTSAKGFSSLPTPTTYAKGSTGCRPAGATRLEQSLRKFITKGDKLNPGVPGWMMGFPVGWVESTLMDTGETISVQLPFIPEYATTSTNGEIATTSTPDQSAPSKLRSQLSGSVTSPRSQVLRANAQPETYIIDQYESLGIIKDNFGFGFVVDWLGFGKVPVPPSGQNLSYIWERDDELIGKLAIAPQALIEKFLESTQLIAIAPSVTHSDAELPASPSVESFISTQSDIKLLSTQEIIETLSISEDELDEFWNNEPALFKGFKIQWLGAMIQKWRVESENRLPQSESISEKFLEDKKQSPSIEPLSLSSVESNTTPENFLEESTADTKQLPSRKRRQRKGCLYKYLENKKLKNGNIASYPRVIGETRDPDNPKHWRWGFNWEEKIDGEWKGRSIGSVPIGAIALIQSMQKSGVPLEEIIAFIRRSKNKR